MGHHSCCNKQKVRRGLWSPEEDEKLINYISTYGHGCWSSVPRLAGLQRCGKSCRLRWINYLRPDLKRGSFSPQEESLIIEFHRMLGNRWAQIAKHLPGRTDNEVKNYWNSNIKKRFISQGTKFAETRILNGSKPEADPPLLINSECFNQMVTSPHEVYIRPGTTTSPDFAYEDFVKTDRIMISYNDLEYYSNLPAAAAAAAAPPLPFDSTSHYEYSTLKAFHQQHYSADHQLAESSCSFDVIDNIAACGTPSSHIDQFQLAHHNFSEGNSVKMPCYSLVGSSPSISQEVVIGSSTLLLPYFSEGSCQSDSHVPAAMSHLEAFDIVLGSSWSSTLSTQNGSMDPGMAPYWET